MHLMTLINDLGQDADLLTKSDRWLEQQRIQIATQMDGLVDELRAILLAQKIKTRLQQTNLVAVRKDSEDECGEPVTLVRITKLRNVNESDGSYNLATIRADGYSPCGT